MSEVKFEFEPFIEDVHIFRGKLVTSHYSSGHVFLENAFNHHYVTVIEETKFKSPVIGKIIRPRWRKYWKDWQRGDLYKENPFENLCNRS